MFAGAYFAARYFPPTYFPKVGAEAVVVPAPPTGGAYSFDLLRGRMAYLPPVPEGYGKNIPRVEPDPRLSDPRFRQQMAALEKARQAVAERKKAEAEAERTRAAALKLAQVKRDEALAKEHLRAREIEIEAKRRVLQKAKRRWDKYTKGS